MNTPLEQRISETNITLHNAKKQCNDWYLQFKHYVAMKEQNNYNGIQR